jgi:hypothetical protein
LSSIANFERIESLVNSQDFDSLPISTVKKELDSLRRNSPTSNNPQFQQRWERVSQLLQSRISAELPWYQKPLGQLAIGVGVVLLSAAALTLFTSK